MKVVEYLGITAAALERACGWSGGTVTTATDGLSAKKIAALHEAYPEINIAWLVTGEGEITTNKDGESPKGTSISDNAHAPQNGAEIAFLRRLVQEQQATITVLANNKGAA